jgi:predicted nucleic acid-binding protein
VRCTIGASVFVASARSDEPNYLLSRKFLKEARSAEVYCPTLALAECAAAIARQTNDPALAKELVSIIEDFPGINLISLDLSLARRAAQIAVEYRLRGADAAYVAVADEFGATLISWDQEMLKRCPAAVATMTPESWCGAR